MVINVFVFKVPALFFIVFATTNTVVPLKLLPEQGMLWQSSRPYIRVYTQSYISAVAFLLPPFFAPLIK